MNKTIGQYLSLSPTLRKTNAITHLSKAYILAGCQKILRTLAAQC